MVLLFLIPTLSRQILITVVNAEMYAPTGVPARMAVASVLMGLIR